MDRRALSVRAHVSALSARRDRSYRRHALIRGENVYPSAIEEAVRGFFGELGGEFEIVVRKHRHMDELIVRVEVGDDRPIGPRRPSGSAARAKIGVRPDDRILRSELADANRSEIPARPGRTLETSEVMLRKLMMSWRAITPIGSFALGDDDRRVGERQQLVGVVDFGARRRASGRRGPSPL